MVDDLKEYNPRRKFCPKCNKYVGMVEWQFCLTCGTRLEFAPSVVCRVCGEEYAPSLSTKSEGGQGYCVKCGAKL